MALVHRQTRGNFRDLHNAMLSLEQMAAAAGGNQVDAAMAGRLTGGRS